MSIGLMVTLMEMSSALVISGFTTYSIPLSLRVTGGGVVERNPLTNTLLYQTDYLKLYGTFCSRQAEALRAIRRNRASNATFQTFILVRSSVHSLV